MTSAEQISLWKDCQAAAKSFDIGIDVVMRSGGPQFELKNSNGVIREAVSVEEIWGMLYGVAFERGLPITGWIHEKGTK